jgi:hypothetical protein
MTPRHGEIPEQQPRFPGDRRFLGLVGFLNPKDPVTARQNRLGHNHVKIRTFERS